ncbi:Single-stranded DNA-binding protein 3 [Schistosoma japonicum]|nr:Single-stranded DNA-binding protein 3 [Schistosoma japonicum]
MYGKSKSVGIPSDAQSKEKLAVYVYEYLVHIGAQKTANSFLQEVTIFEIIQLLKIRWDKSISVGEPPGFLHSWWSVFWDLYSAAPERRDTHEHSSEAKAFHDYGFVNSGYPNGLPHPNHPVMSGPGVSGPGGAGPGMPPPLGPPGPDPVSMRQRPSGPPLMPGGGLQNAGPGLQGPSPHHPSVRFHQPGAGGYPGIPVGGGMIPPHANLLPGSGPPHPMHGNPMMPHHHHPSGAIVGHPRPRWIGPSISQQAGGPPCPSQQGGGPPVCSGSAGPNSVSSAGPGSVGPGSCGGSGIVPSPGHPGTPTQHAAPHLAAPSPINNQSNDHQPSGSGMSSHQHHPTPPHYMGGQPPQQQTPPTSNSCLPPEYAARPSPHLVFSGGGPGSTPDNGMFGAGPGCSDSGLLNGSVGPPRSSGMMPPPPPDYSSGMPSSASNPYPPCSDLKASPLHGGPGMGCDMVSSAGGPPPLMPSDYPQGNGPGGNGPGQGNSGFPGDSVMMMPPPQQQGVLQQHMSSGPQGQAPPPPQYVPSGGQHSGSSGGPPSSMQSVCGGSNPSPAGGPGSVQFPVSSHDYNPC